MECFLRRNYYRNDSLDKNNWTKRELVLNCALESYYVKYYNSKTCWSLTYINLQKLY